MFFPKLNMNQDKLDVLILLIQADYQPKDNYELSKLISSNFNLNQSDVYSALESQKAFINEDYERESWRISK